MAAHSSTQLANGHTLTIVEVQRDELDSIARPAARSYFRVDERNELGTFICVGFSSIRLDEVKAWVARAAERGYGLRPTIGGTTAPTPLRTVVNMESDEPELLGAYVETDAESGQVWYTWPDGSYHAAPGDCVRVVTVTL